MFLTKVSDETADMSNPQTKCEDLPDVDEKCIDQQLESGPDSMGTTTGLWVPGINDCNAWVRRAIGRCPKVKCNPGPPDWTQNLENRKRWGSGMGPK